MRGEIQNRQKETGSVFFIILIAVVLFAALMFTFSRSAHHTGGSMNEKQNEINAHDLLSYAQRLERTVSRMLLKSISESDIIFETAADTICTSGSTCVFAPDGGHFKSYDFTDMTITYYSEFDNTADSFHVDGIGTANKEIVMTATVPLSVCEEINKTLGLSTAPIQSDTFSGDWIVSAYSGEPQACFNNGGTYTYYHVLVNR